MSKEVSIISLGVFVALLPFFGLPGSWRTTLLVLSGIAIACIGVFLRNETLSRGTPRRADGFIDNRLGREAKIAEANEFSQEEKQRIQ